MQIWWKKWTGNCVSRENPFNIRHCVICVMTLDLMQNSERWLNGQIFKIDLQFWAVWRRLKYPTINELPFLAFVQADAFGKMKWVPKVSYAQFFIQLVYKPHLGTWILLFGLFGQLMAVRKNIKFQYLWAPFLGIFFLNIVVSALKSWLK